MKGQIPLRETLMPIEEELYYFCMDLQQITTTTNDLFANKKMPYDHVICDEDSVDYTWLWERRYIG